MSSRRRRADSGSADGSGEKASLRGWFARLLDDPIALGTMVAALAAAITAGISYGATRDALQTTALDNAPALYLACTQKPKPIADIFYPVADMGDYPGVYYETGAPTLFCSLSNISKRPLVNVRIGMLALFYDRKTPAPTSVEPYYESLFFPDDGGIGPVTNRIQTINLAPNSTVTLALPNTSYHTLFLNPAERAEAQYPGSDTIRCADVYLAPGTLRALVQGPMQRLPKDMQKQPAGSIPSPAPGPCIDFNRLVQAQARPQPWIPGVAARTTFHGKGGVLEVQLPHE